MRIRKAIPCRCCAICSLLEQQGELKRITLPVDPHLEITEIADRTLRAG
ncbi:hypothetical protein, partial [Escherichia coli]